MTRPTLKREFPDTTEFQGDGVYIAHVRYKIRNVRDRAFKLTDEEHQWMVESIQDLVKGAAVDGLLEEQLETTEDEPYYSVGPCGVWTLESEKNQEVSRSRATFLRRKQMWLAVYHYVDFYISDCAPMDSEHHYRSELWAAMPTALRWEVLSQIRIPAELEALVPTEPRSGSVISL